MKKDRQNKHADISEFNKIENSNHTNAMKKSSFYLGIVSFLCTLFFSSVSAFAFDVLVQLNDLQDPIPRTGQVTYEIIGENSQPNNAHNTTMAFPIPADTTYVSLDDGGSGDCAYYTSGGTRPSPDLYPGRDVVSCNLGILQPSSGTGLPRTLLVTVEDNDGDNTTNIYAEASIQAENDPAYPGETDGNPDNNATDQNTTVTNGADITVNLTGTPNPVTAGGQVTYTGIVSNQGPDDESSDITVVFQLSANETYQSKTHAGWNCNYNSGTNQLSCTRTIADGGIQANTDAPPITFTTLVTDISSGTTTTNATVQPHDDDPNPNDNTDSVDIQVEPGADVAVTISAVPNTLLNGDTTTITLNPQNLGPIDAEDVVVTYTLPADFTLNATPTGAGWTCDDTNLPAITCTRTGNAPYPDGANDPITFVLTYPNWTGTPSYDHTVSISTSTSEAADRLFNNSDTVTITTDQQAVDLGITKSKVAVPNVHPGAPVEPGATLKSSIRVHNYGPLDFTPDTDTTLTVTDTLNTAYETFQSAAGTNWTCSYSAPVVTCTYGAALAPGENSSYLNIYTEVINTLGGDASITATNTASVIYDDPGLTDNNSSNNTTSASVTVTREMVDLRISHDVTPTTLPQDQDDLVYTINVCNHDNNDANRRDATGVVMRQEIDGYFNSNDTTGIAVTGKPANYNCSIAANVVTCTQQNGVLALSDCENNPTNDTFEITVTRPLVAGEKTATATTYSTDLADANQGDNTADAVATVITAIDVEIQTKTVNPNPVKSGTEATYTLEIRNKGPEAAANVQVVDTFDFDAGDTGFTFISANASGGGTCTGMTAGTSYTDGAALTCTWTTIAGNGGETITFTIRPNYWDGATYPGREFDNSAVISTSSYDRDSSNNEIGPVTLVIENDSIDLLIDNNDSPDPLGHDPNDPTNNTNNDVVYDLSFENRGPSYASDVKTVFTMTPKSGKTVEFLCDDANAGATATACLASTNQCTVSNGSNPVTGPATLEITCEHGEMAAAPGTRQHRYLRFRVHSAPDAGGDTHQTTATISGEQVDSNNGNNQENENTTVRGLADLELTKSVSASPVNKTQAFEWTLEVTNNGPAESRNTVVTDDLSDYDLYDEPITCTNQTTPSSNCSCTVNTNSIMTCSLGTLAVNDVVQIVIPVKKDDAGSYTNCANATTDDVDPDSSNNTNVCANVTVEDVFHPSDYGDAPDASNAIATGNYQTQLNYGGARHYLNTSQPDNTPYLGSCVDADGAGTLQNAQATADDENTGGTVIGTCTSAGDEDGVQIPVLVAGKTQDITVTIGGAACRLSGWIDFNQDGDWTDTGEKVIDDTEYGVGTHTISITVPNIDTIVVGHSYARFRCATEQGLTPTGAQSNIAEADRTHPDYALDGEVEDYKVALQPDFAVTNVDYGDAPDPSYPTMQVNDGASHILGVTDAPILGGCVDSEQNAHQSSDATGDDTATAGSPGTTVGTCVNDDDEDGVSFPNLTAGENATLTIKVSGGACRLNGWIDFDRDGIWQDDEQVFTNFNLSVGDHSLTIPLPADSGIGNTIARFRCSKNSNTLGPIGAAPDGEVEDYRIELLGFISGQVRMDADADGDLTDTDAPISGVTINLINPDTNTIIATTTTDSDGNYKFVDLPVGNYVVQEVDPQDHSSTNDTDNPNQGAMTDNLIAVTLDDSGSSTGNDFIDTHTARLGNRVWFDSNQDGIQTVGEPGISGVTVKLFTPADPSTPVMTTTTDGQGFYEFRDVHVGDYYIEFVQPAGYTVTQQDVGGDDGLDSDGNNSNPSHTGNFNVPVGSSNMTLDCGMYLTSGDEPAQISDYVWYDSDQDGIQDPGESGVSGVTVNLLDASDNVIATTTTDGNGHYVFDGLPAGTYTVEFVAPGYTFSDKGQGGDTATDSDADPATGKTDPIVLNAGEKNSDIDAGISVPGQLPASISNFVWNDSNQNGIQDAGEPGIGGVTVTLYAANDTNTPLSTVLTDPSGNYAFNGLLPGDYVVHFGLPEGYLYTSQGAGDTATDSNADPNTGMSSTVTLSAGENNPTIDAGMYLESGNLISIGDLVYLDTNLNNSYDAGEGIGGVDLYLYDLYGTLIGQTTTAADGSYLFTNLAPGSYVVKVDTTDLPEHAFQIEDPDSELDSSHTLIDLNTDILTVDFGYRPGGVDVELTKTFELLTDNDDNGKISKGDILRFTVSLLNKGPNEATGIIVHDQLPNGYELVSTSLTQGSYNAPLWDVGTLPINGTASLIMDVRIVPKPGYKNTAEVIACNEVDLDSTPGNDIEMEDDQASVTPDVEGFPWYSFIPTLPRCPNSPDYCYLISDEDSTVTKTSALFKYDFNTNSLSFLGRLGVRSVEGSTLSLDGTTLYAVNNGRLGTIDTTPGTMSSFTPVSNNKLGFGRGAKGRIRILDIDGMTFDPTTGELYACARRSDDYEGFDMLVKINPNTGKLVRNAFGRGVEYLVLDTHELNNAHTDALSFSSEGVLYGVVENSGGGGGDTMVIIDTTTGHITPVTRFSINGRPLEDVEGLTFYYRNTLFGTTGTEFTDHGYNNSLFRIDLRTGKAVRIQDLDKPINGFTPYDFETISCPVCKP